jgi:hypothetical protein
MIEMQTAEECPERFVEETLLAQSLDELAVRAPINHCS